MHLLADFQNIACFATRQCIHGFLGFLMYMVIREFPAIGVRALSLFHEAGYQPLVFLITENTQVVFYPPQIFKICGGGRRGASKSKLI
jgi:hypothetical protein